MVSIKALTLSVFGFAAFSNAVVIEMFADGNCGQSVGTRNIYDNTCAYTQGFQSFKIVTASGAGGQQLKTYSNQACAGDVTYATCANDVSDIGKCHPATNRNGGSNAASSYSIIGC